MDCPIIYIYIYILEETDKYQSVELMEQCPWVTKAGVPTTNTLDNNLCIISKNHSFFEGQSFQIL
jgi:hypothetical protein